MKRLIQIFISAIITMTAINCSKETDSNLTNLPQDDTVNFRYLNTNELINCMLINDIKLIKDCFFIKSESVLQGNLTENICNSSLPQVNFQDSMIIGYTTEIQGSGNFNERLVIYDSAKNTLTYSITVFSNDTSMLNTELNWITLPAYDIDSIIFKLIIIKQ
jgi:hypothetical protein